MKTLNSLSFSGTCSEYVLLGDNVEHAALANECENPEPAVTTQFVERFTSARPKITSSDVEVLTHTGWVDKFVGIVGGR